MISEHTFITTLPPEEALSRIHAALELAGHSVTQTGTHELAAVRGKNVARGARNVTECPQRVTVTWDRGRVTVGALIQEKPRWDRSLTWTGVPASAETGRLPKRRRAYGDVVFATVDSVERATTASAEFATSAWRAMEHAMRLESVHAVKRGRMIAAALLTGLVAFVMLLIVAVSART